MFNYIKFFVRGFKDVDNDNCFAFIEQPKITKYVSCSVWQRHPAAIHGANFRGFFYRVKINLKKFIQRVDPDI